MNEYSVLMSVYIKEKPEFLNASIESMLNQTILPSEFLIVCDGPLTKELEAVLDKYKSNPIFKIHRLPKNIGLGGALRYGVGACNHEFILRMDSDDISLPNRAEKELELLNKGFDLVGSYVSEFVDSPNNIKGFRIVPLNQDDIVKFSRKRTPFNHPSVAYKKSLVISSGNYSIETRYIQDYFLWIKCIQHGCKCCNTPDILVNMRSGTQMRSRRKGKEYRKSFKIIFKYMYETKFISFWRYFFNILNYSIYSIIGPRLKEKIVYSFLRKQNKKK